MHWAYKKKGGIKLTGEMSKWLIKPKVRSSNAERSTPFQSEIVPKIWAQNLNTYCFIQNIRENEKTPFLFPSSRSFPQHPDMI